MRPRKGHTAGSGAPSSSLSVEPALLVDRPECEQVAGELGLGRAQLVALSGGAAGARFGRARGARSRPLGRDAMHGKRQAAALRGERLNRGRLDRRGEVEARDLLHGLFAERTQLERPCGLSCERRGWLRTRVQDHEQQPPPHAVADERGRPIEHVPAGVVGVVEDEQGRAFALVRAPNRVECVLGWRHRARV